MRYSLPTFKELPAWKRSVVRTLLVVILFGAWVFALAAPVEAGFEYSWTKTTGAEGYDSGAGVAVDSQGNVYSTGSFRDTVNFDPGGTNQTFTEVGGDDMFLTKTNADGTYAWTRVFQGYLYVHEARIEVDSSDNVYLTGIHYGTMNFDPGGTDETITNASGYNFFLVRINADGTFGWVRVITGAGGSNLAGSRLAIDDNDNMYIAGAFFGTVNFDPGGTDETITSPSYNGFAMYDAFLVKINADGTYGWTRVMGSLENTEYIRDVAVDGSGNIYVTGSFIDTFGGGVSNFDPGGAGDLHVSAGDSDIFLTRINADNTYGWTRTIGGTSNYDFGQGVVLDSAGSVYVAGYFGGDVDFDPGTGVDTHSAVGYHDIFLTKFDASGIYDRTRTIGGPSAYPFLIDIAVDGDDNVYLAGGFSDPVDFDPGAGTELRTPSYLDGFVTSVLADGTYGWTYTVSGTESNEQVNGVTVGPFDNLYLTGRFAGIVDFDPGTGTDEYPPSGVSEVFLTRFAWNTPPVASGGATATNEDTVYAGTLQATDIEGDPLTFSIVSNGTLGTAVVTDVSTGAYTYTPNPDANGPDFFTFKASDGSLDSNAAIVSVAITPENDEPLATGDTITTNEDTVYTGAFQATDVEGDPLTFSIVINGSLGTAVVTDPSTGAYTYTPIPDVHGVDAFTFKVNDGLVDSDTRTIAVTIDSVNDRPVPTASDIAVAANTIGSTQIDPGDPDIGDTHTFAVSTSAVSGEASVNAAGLATYTPNTDFAGTDSFSVKVTDSSLLTGYVLIGVTVEPVDSTPPASGTFTATPLNTVITLSWSGFTDDLSGIDFYTIVYDTAGYPADCTSGTEVYSGVDATYPHNQLINGTTYYYRICATDGYGNTSAGVTASATPIATVDGISLPSDDTGPEGVSRTDSGDDTGNVDSATGNAKVDVEYEFNVVVKDPTGNPPVSTKVYVTQRSAAADFHAYDAVCEGDVAAGAACKFDTKLGPSAAIKYYFESVLDDGTVVRYPAVGVIDGPAVELLTGYNMVSVPRDVAAAALDGATGLGETLTYRWVSNGLSNGSSNYGSYEQVTGVESLAQGEAYFMWNTSGGSDTLPELAAYTDITDPTYEITLQPGWNLVSNPYIGNVSLSDVQVQKGSDAPVAWLQAATDGWVKNAIYYYNGSDWGETYTVESAGGVPDATLTPWLGYWVYMYKTDGTYKLIIPKP